MAGFDFSQIPSVLIPRSRFPIAKNILTTANPDVVIPIYWCEVLHSDTFDMKKKKFLKNIFFS